VLLVRPARLLDAVHGSQLPREAFLLPQRVGGESLLHLANCLADVVQASAIHTSQVLAELGIVLSDPSVLVGFGCTENCNNGYSGCNNCGNSGCSSGNVSASRRHSSRAYERQC
jgi:hypothetical protein